MSDAPNRAVSWTGEQRRIKQAHHLQYFWTNFDDEESLLEIARIDVEPALRRQGHGEQAMRDVLRWADQNSVTVTLTPSSDLGTPKGALTKWYRAMGFKANKGRSRDFRTRDTMIRKPKSTSNPLALRDYSAYCEEIARRYDEMPAFDPSEVWRWELLLDHVLKFYDRIRRNVDIYFVAGQPYATAQEMRDAVKKTGEMYISTDFNEHPLFTPQQNLKFRAVHDYIVHIMPGDRGPDFTERGEIRAYNLHRRLAPPDSWPALFTEVAAQACYFNERGHFPDQKLAVLRGIDFYDVGKLSGFEVEDKQLRAANPSMTGYKVMRVEDSMLVAGADARQRFPLARGAKIRMPGCGVYLSPHREYVLTYYSGLAPTEALLTVEFDPDALLSGDLRDREPEVSVREVTVVDYEILPTQEENPSGAPQDDHIEWLAARLARGGR